MVEVEVENFQSIEKASFKIDGFTALVGRSNIGKSALVRALRNALTGALGTDFVRHGASCERRLKDNKKCRCQTTVRIRTGSVEIVWEKGDGVNRYTLTKPGEPPVLYDKVGAGTPEFLRPEFAPVKVGDSHQLIQVSEQFSPIFLLDVAGPTVADVLSDVARLDDINEAVRLVTKDRKEASTTRTVREKDVGDIATDLAKYIDLDHAVADVRRIETRHEAIGAHQARVAQAQGFLNHLEGLAKGIRALQAATKPELPDEAKIQGAAERARQGARLHEEWVSRTAAVERLSGVDAIDLPDLEAVTTCLRNTRRVDEWWRKAQSLKGDFDRGKALAGTKDPDQEALLKARDQLFKAQSLLERVQTTVKTIQSLQEQMATAEKEEKAALEELHALGVCPTCSQTISTDTHLHLEAAS